MALTLSGTIGMLFIGMLFATVLSGVTHVQTVTFLRANKRDHSLHKVAVLLLWMLDTLQIIVVANMVYYYLVEDPFNVESPSVWSFPTHILLQKLIMPLTQSVYVMRIWKLTPHLRLLPIALSLLVAANTAIGLYVGIRVFEFKLLQDMETLPFGWAIYLILCATSSTDILIAVALIYAIAKSNMSLRWTNSNFIMLLAYMINTGAIVSVCSTAGIIAFAVSPTTFVFLSIEVVLTKLYVNCFLAMLNARFYLQRRKEDDAMTSPIVLRSHVDSFASNPRDYGITPRPTINEIGLLMGKNSSEGQFDNAAARTTEVTIQKEEHSSKI